MIIDLIEGRVVINGFQSLLKSYQSHQLNYWEFSLDPMTGLLTTDLDYDKILLKITKYFDKEKVPYTLSENCKKIFDEIIKDGKEFEAHIKSARDYKNGLINNVELDEFISFLENSIYRKLKEHQVKAALHLKYVKNGANFSVPGSGKTSVVLTVFEKLRLEGKVNTLFVVGPPSSFGPWKNEFIETLGRDPNLYIFAGDFKFNREIEYYKTENFKELYLTTFHTLLNDIDGVIDFLSNKNLMVMLVIDEAHYIKQINGNWASAVLKCAEHALYRCVLTGTPMPKSYEDLFNLFEFLWPNKNLLTSEDKLRLKKLESQKANEEAKNILDERIGPIFYRVRKKDLKLKDQIFHPPIQITMNKEERIIYDAIFNKIRDFAQNDYLMNVEFIIRLIKGRMMRLRQSISYTKLLSNSIDNYDEEIVLDSTTIAHKIINYDNFEVPAKLEYLIEFVIDLQKKKQKVVIWSNFIGTIELIEKYLNKNDIYNKKIIGATPVEKESYEVENTREKIRNEFVNIKSGLNVLIANPAACAESISLHQNCYNAIYYDLSFNCAQYLQSLDRIHRVGGSELHEANYYFLQYKNTIDSEILENLNQKAKKMYEIIEGDYSIYSLDMFDDHDEVEAYKRIFHSNQINE